MSFDADEEILQDFLVEAGEILEQLSEQLVDLENRPDDVDLLNAIFRGFHTVKGGAGFLQLDALVDLCHVAENVFDLLRNGKLGVNSEIMDVVLQALDSVNEMFGQVNERQEPKPADPSILSALSQLVESGNNGGGDQAQAVPAPETNSLEEEVSSANESENSASVPENSNDGPGKEDEISDDEFEQLLDALHSKDSPEAPQSSPAAATAAEVENNSADEDKGNADDQGAELFIDEGPSDAADNSSSPSANSPASSSEAGANEITEDEFDALLDQLHGKGKHTGSPKDVPAPESASSDGADSNRAEVVASAGDSDEITEHEFEHLLDELHGKGKKIRGSAGSSDGNISVESSKQGEGGSVASTESDLITDQEFESLLDDLHGTGKGPTSKEGDSGAKSAGRAPSNPSAPSSVPSEPKVEANVSQTEKAAAKPVSAPSQSAAPTTNSSATAGAAVERTKSKTPAVANKRNMRETPVAAETTVRVDTKRLDDIMNMVGELVLVRNRLVRLGGKSSDEAISKAVSNLDVVTADLQMSVMKTRMQPIKKVFGRFPRVVRDLARNLKKEINLELQGEETDLDKNLVEALADPLVHLVRNSVDHGIEMPDERESIGKSRAGKIILAAQQEGDHIVLSITDDGGGMDPAMLKQKAVTKGLMDEEAAERLNDNEAFNLIFHPGFSTKEEVSDVSGRGVGMDVVKTKISQLNGTIDVHSEKGQGTKIAIKVPLTLAIMPTLMVMLGDQTFALPLVSVNEIFHMDLSRTNIVDGQEVVIVRDKALPLFHLKRWLVMSGGLNSGEESAHVVIVSVGTQKVGFVVDQLIGQEEVVIKPLGKMLHGTPGMAGATITGDGRIALILDVPSMLKRYANHA